MRRFQCSCGQPLFFDNDSCGQCGAEIGFDPDTMDLHALAEVPDKQRCANYPSAIRCNWLVPVADDDDQCESCRLTQTRPSPSNENDLRLARLEAAKRRWLYGVRWLGLPVTSFHQQLDGGLAFDFLEDQPGNPDAEDEHVLTGHANGLITLNLAEADPVERAVASEQMNEQYRTLVGHFRHESGHYFWDQLIRDSRYLTEGRALFGDERADYAKALKQHYANSAAIDWQANYISSYASSHPWEDWAETWAHYLHLADTLETAHSFALCADWQTLARDFDQLIASWRAVAVMLNELNRSMGQSDGYPFVLQPLVVEKLRFIHRVIGEQAG